MRARDRQNRTFEEAYRYRGHHTRNPTVHYGRPRTISGWRCPRRKCRCCQKGHHPSLQHAWHVRDPSPPRQMLESMIEHPRPTRAEASDVANVRSPTGCDCVHAQRRNQTWAAYPLEAVLVHGPHHPGHRARCGAGLCGIMRRPRISSATSPTPLERASCVLAPSKSRPPAIVNHSPHRAAHAEVIEK